MSVAWKAVWFGLGGLLYAAIANRSAREGLVRFIVGSLTAFAVFAVIAWAY